MNTLLLGLVAALLSGVPLGHQWSPEQQDVIDAVKGCWDVWMGSVEEGTPEAFIDQCLTDDASFWVGTDGAPNNSQDFLRRTWGEETGVDLAWLDLRPLSVKLQGDVAVIHFYGYWRLPGPDGPEVREWARTEVWRHEGGQWRLWAGHASPRDR